MSSFMNKLKRPMSFVVIIMIMITFIMQSSVDSFAQGKDTETPGVFRVGMEANYAPFNWTQPNDANGAVAISNSSGEYANGYDVEIAKKIAEGLGLKLEIVKMEWDGLAPAVMAGKIDAIIAGMSPTAERKTQIDFSNNYYTSDLVIVTQKEGKYAAATNLAGFSGAKITGQLNTFHYSVIDQIKGVSKQTAMDSFPTMISALKSGKIDGYVSEKPGAMAAVAANEDLTFKPFGEGNGFNTSSEDTSIAVGLRKNSPLTAKINDVLANISQKERDDIMNHEVELNVHGGPTGFFPSVLGLLKNYGSLFVKGAGLTLLIATVSTILGFFIGVIVAAIRAIKVNKKHNPVKYYIQRIVNFILACYVEIFRGTPMMVQAMLIYYGSKMFFQVDISAMFTAFFVVSINTGAYLSEVVRGGINSVDIGQSEACRGIGMTHTQSMFHVILPQAIRSILPSIGNEFVINIKDTSVLNVISVTELFFISKSIAGTTYLIFQTFFITAVIYFILTFTVTRILLALEKKLYGDKVFVMESTTGGAL